MFRITYTSKNGSTYYNISTLGRIGYAVGGDNIDVALMEYIFTMVSDNENKRHDYEKKHKTEILEAILDLKKNIINANRGYKDPGQISALLDKEGFCKFANRLLDSFGGIDTLVMEDEDFTKKILQKIINSKELLDFVYSRVKDAVVEILKYPDVKPVTIDKLLFAGRSTMFPGIRLMVETLVKSHSCCVKTPNIFDDDEVKTSVAYGACWYGIYNGLVTLDNSRLTSAYGFKQTTGTDSILKVLLNQNSVFGDDNMVHGSVDIESLFDGDGQTVSFYQIMGSGAGDDLLSEKNRYKVNYLTGIPVTQLTKSIGIDVGRNNFATCSVTFDTGMTERRSDLDIQTRDITEENDWAYVFATTDEESVRQSASVANVSRSNQKTERKQAAERKAPQQTGKWYDNLDNSNKRRF